MTPLLELTPPKFAVSGEKERYSTEITFVILSNNNIMECARHMHTPRSCQQAKADFTNLQQGLLIQRMTAMISSTMPLFWNNRPSGICDIQLSVSVIKIPERMHESSNELYTWLVQCKKKMLYAHL
jgi:hypothetical protein